MSTKTRLAPVRDEELASALAKIKLGEVKYTPDIQKLLNKFECLQIDLQTNSGKIQSQGLMFLDPHYSEVQKATIRNQLEEWKQADLKTKADLEEVKRGMVDAASGRTPK